MSLFMGLHAFFHAFSLTAVKREFRLVRDHDYAFGCFPLSLGGDILAAATLLRGSSEGLPQFAAQEISKQV